MDVEHDWSLDDVHVLEGHVVCGGLAQDACESGEGGEEDAVVDVVGVAFFDGNVFVWFVDVFTEGGAGPDA